MKAKRTTGTDPATWHPQPAPHVDGPHRTVWRRAGCPGDIYVGARPGVGTGKRPTDDDAWGENAVRALEDAEP